MKRIILVSTLIIVSFYCKSQTDTTSSGKTPNAVNEKGDSKKGDTKNAAKAKAMTHLDSCFRQCGGSSFDTCCPVKKECCETDLVKVPKNSSIKKINTYILQKNFADIQPFSYEYFRLNGKTQNLCIRICNINRIAYDINANGQIVKASLPDTSIFDGLAKLYQNTPAVPKDTGDETLPKDGSANEKVGVTGDKNLPVIPKRPTQKKTAFERLQQSADSIKNLIKPLMEDLFQQLNNLEHYALFAADVPVIIGGECCSQQRIKDRIGNQQNIKAFRSDITFDNVLGIIKASIPPLFDSTKDNEKKIRELLKELGLLINNYQKNYCETNRDMASNCTLLPNILKLPGQESVDKSLAIAAKSDKAELLKSLRVLEDLMARVNNNSNFFYTTCFDKEDAEFIKVFFKATAKEGYADKLDSQVYRYSVPVTGRFKWAIGPSLNFHFGGTLVNQSYSIDSARNSSGNIMSDTFGISKNSQRSRVVPHVGFMVHFYWQRHWPVTPGITIGISTSPTQFSDLRAYLGASGIIGGSIKGKLILSAGLAGAAVDRLKPNLVEGLNPKNRILFNGNNLPGSEQLVDKVFRIGFFAGITYNLKD